MQNKYDPGDEFLMDIPMPSAIKHMECPIVQATYVGKWDTKTVEDGISNGTLKIILFAPHYAEHDIVYFDSQNWVNDFAFHDASELKFSPVSLEE